MELLQFAFGHPSGRICALWYDLTYRGDLGPVGGVGCTFDHVQCEARLAIVTSATSVAAERPIIIKNGLDIV